MDTYKNKEGNKIFKVPDPYRFLEDPDSKETQAWVAAEDQITQKFMGGLGMTSKIYEKIKALSNYAKISLP